MVEKGSGKTALFAQVRDRKRRDRQNIVIDLKPEGYKLLKFKEDVLKYMQKGTLEHTIMAIWEYVLLLEIAYKLLEKDQKLHTRDHTLYEPYTQLRDLYYAIGYSSEGDFSERMNRLLDVIRDDFQATYGKETDQNLSETQVTELIYKHNIPDLLISLNNYLALKSEVFLLIDNVDKGWPTHGIQDEDLLIIRTLLDATRKIEREFARVDINCKTLVFLRNDVYELLVEETPDRGKEETVALDWADPEALLELLRKRFVYGELPDDTVFGKVWHQVVTSHIDGEESSQYLVERCLM